MDGSYSEKQLKQIHEKLDRLQDWTEKVDRIAKIVWDAKPQKDIATE